MMDKSTRDQNDEAGNPIGQASLKAARQIAKKSETDMPDEASLLTPWCTCFGSQVCSHYAQTTGTKIKFVNDPGIHLESEPGKGFCMASLDSGSISGCEGWAREQYQMVSHETPGVALPQDDNHCDALQGQAEVDISSCQMPSPK